MPLQADRRASAEGESTEWHVLGELQIISKKGTDLEEPPGQGAWGRGVQGAQLPLEFCHVS